jgi:hypothetical protein
MKTMQVVAEKEGQQEREEGNAFLEVDVFTVTSHPIGMEDKVRQERASFMTPIALTNRVA